MCDVFQWLLPCIASGSILAVCIFHMVAAFVRAVNRLRKGDDVGEVFDELADEVEDAVDDAKGGRSNDL